MIVVLPPRFCHGSGLVERQEPMLVQALVGKPAVEALHVTVLPRARLLDIQRADARPRQPFLDLLDNELGRTTHGEQWEVIEPALPKRAA